MYMVNFRVGVNVGGGNQSTDLHDGSVFVYYVCWDLI